MLKAITAAAMALPVMTTWHMHAMMSDTQLIIRIRIRNSSAGFALHCGIQSANMYMHMANPSTHKHVQYTVCCVGHAAWRVRYYNIATCMQIESFRIIHLNSASCIDDVKLYYARLEFFGALPATLPGAAATRAPWIATLPAFVARRPRTLLTRPSESGRAGTAASPPRATLR